MTDESNPTPESMPEPAPAPSSPSALSAMRASLNTGETLIAVGALLLLVGVYLLGDVILDEWTIDVVTWSASLGALALMYVVKMQGHAVPLPYEFSVRTLSYLVGALGVSEVLWFIEGNRAEGLEVVFALVYFAGVIAMVVGARQLKD